MPQLQIALGGSAAPRRLCAEAARRLTADLVFGYGSTEAGLTAVGPANLVNEQPGAAGYRVPWARIEIVDEQHTPLAPGQIGMVRVRTDEMAEGYLDGATSSGEGAFHDGWFYPGDMGMLRPGDGLFVLEGRSDDVMNIGGVKVSAWTVEERLMENPAVREAAAVALPGAGGVPELVVAVVGDLDPGRVAEDYASRYRQRLRVVPLERIPRNQMGKIIRAEVVAALAGGRPA